MHQTRLTGAARLSLVGAALLAGALTACNGSDDDDGAKLRVLHASPDAPPVDVAVDNEGVLTALPYGRASDYLDVEEGQRNIKVAATGTATNVIDANVPFQNEVDYTVIASGRLASVSPVILVDDTRELQDGQAGLRVAHAAPSAPAVDVYVTAPGVDIDGAAPTLSGVSFPGTSEYLVVPAGSYQIRVTPARSKSVVIDAGTLQLDERNNYTAVALDAPGGGSPFSAILLDDSQ